MFFTSSGLKNKLLASLPVKPLQRFSLAAQSLCFAWLTLALSLLTGAFFLGAQAYNSSTEALPKQSFQLGGHHLLLQVPQTTQQYQDGLMYRQKLAPKEGMLFHFAAPQVTHFWMKHCRFSMDYVYGAQQQVLAFAENIPPCPAKSETCPVYSSPVPVTWVLELPAGSVKQLHIKVGMVLKAL